MKNKRILLALLALALAVTTALPAAMAYFTTNAQATGSRALKLGGTTTIEETMAEWTKEVTISADDNSQPMWVRARAYSTQTLVIVAEAEGDWAAGGDGWYYFTTPLAKPADGKTAVEKTTQLLVRIDPIKVSGPNEIPDGFDVTVVYESAPVIYKDDGTQYGCMDKDVWSGTVVKTNTQEPAGT